VRFKTIGVGCIKSSDFGGDNLYRRSNGHFYGVIFAVEFTSNKGISHQTGSWSRHAIVCVLRCLRESILNVNKLFCLKLKINHIYIRRRELKKLNWTTARGFLIL
jgi:hypothetical protein